MELGLAAGAIIAQTAVLTGQFLTNQLKTTTEFLEANASMSAFRASKVGRWLEKASVTASTFGRKVAIGAAQFVKQMRTIAKFFPIISVALIFLAFISKPFEFILLFVGGLVVTFMYIIFLILTNPPLVYIPYIIFYLVLGVIPLLASIILWGVILGVVCLLCLLIALIDKCTAGRLKHMILCQNSPAAWFSVPNFHLKNSFTRGMFCSSPCKTGYAPDANTGMLCTKIPSGVPSYCSHAKVMQIFSGAEQDTLSTPLDFADFNTGTSMRYVFSPPSSRESMLMNHFEKRERFTDSCTAPMVPYTDVTLSICSNLDRVDSKLSAAQRERLKTVCRRSFCSATSTYPFCAEMSSAIDGERPFSIVRSIIGILISIIVFLICLRFVALSLLDRV